MKRQNLIAMMAGLALLSGGAGWYALPSTAPANAATGSDDTVSALVHSVLVHQQVMATSMDVFGEIVPAQISSLSFAKPGQLRQILIVTGQAVRRGEPLAVLDGDPASQSAYTQALSAVSLSQRELRRTEELLALQLATRSQVDAAAKTLQDAQSALSAQLKTGAAQTASTLLAPFDAVVTAVPVLQGERLTAGTTVVQLGRTDTLRAQLAIEPAQSAQLRPALPVLITALQGDAVSANASITEIQHLVDAKTQMVGAFVALPASKHTKFISGMRIQARIELGQKTVWSVPRQAVLSDDKGAYLFQVVSGKAHRVDVSKVLETALAYGVEGPLAASRPVVLLGNYELQDGMRVRESAL